MSEIDRIRRFLDGVRGRVLLRDGLRALSFGAAGAGATVLALAVLATLLGPAGFWWPLTLTLMGIAVLAALVLGLVRPLRALRGASSTARALGRLRPPLAPLAGDVLSAVELGDLPPGTAIAAGPHDAGGISPALVRAFQGRVADALAPIDPRYIVSMRPATYGAVALLGVLVLLGAGARLAPDLVGRGLGILSHRPTRFEGAAVSAVPIVGDVRITYDYPAYTGLPRRTVEGSTGDIVAVKGTRVTIETTPLRAARKALLLLGETGENGEVLVHVAKGKLTTNLTLIESGTYRFWLQPLLGRAVRELRSHRLEAELDRPPRVEIRGPADRLDLPTPRPIEVGFAADDDYGLASVELVFRVDDTPEQRQLLKDAHGARVAEGRTLWDPSRLGLSAGARIAYHIEARDRDDVSGAKVGTSRTLYVTIARPQESLDDRLDHQREILERLTSVLADRLELRAAPPSNGAGSAAEPPSLLARRAQVTAVHEAEEGHLALLGRVLDDDRREPTLGKALRAALAGVADRLGRLLREEKVLLGTNGLATGRGAVAKLDAADDKQVAELEKDVLLLDDLIGRQRLEDLASIGRELTDAHRRLQDLLARYNATKDEALRRQLEREVRDLRARIGELARKIADLKSRNDVPEEWRNLPDTKELAERAKKLDDLLSEGNPKALSQALDDLGKDLRSLRQMLDDNAEGFGAERFPQENRVVSDLMKKIGDIEGDQRALAGETQSLSEKQDAETEKRLRAGMADWSRKENEKVDKLRQKLGELRTGGPENPLTEEVERARESTRQLKRLLSERDLGEAKNEAERAATSLDRAGRRLEDDRRRKRRPGDTPGQRTDAEDAMADAHALAAEIENDVKSFMPKPDDTLSPEDHKRMQGEADRQNAIGDRTRDAAEEAGRRLGKLPGLERAEEDLKSAADQMRQASDHLQKSEGKQANGAQRNAADRLAKLRDTLQDRSIGGGKQQRDPVRIPGADESNAPRAWRQELLDAMKEKAPERFRDDVRRYYEELVR